jgi:hypothetical protein
MACGCTKPRRVCQLDGIADQLGTHVLGHRVTGDFPIEQVDLNLASWQKYLEADKRERSALRAGSKVEAEHRACGHGGGNRLRHQDRQAGGQGNHQRCRRNPCLPGY